jgi:hypothetical protein
MAKVELRYHIDFLFDFERQYVFEENGALASELAAEALRGRNDLEDTVHWLRGNGKPTA